MTDSLHWREWLVRQLRDDRLSDKEVASILAWHPAITDEWRTPELRKLMGVSIAHHKGVVDANEVYFAIAAYAKSEIARAHQEGK